MRACCNPVPSITLCCMPHAPAMSNARRFDSVVKVKRRAPALVDVFTGPIRPCLEGTRLRTCGREGPPITSLDLGAEDTIARYAWGANMAIRRTLLDRLALAVRTKLNKNAAALPLAKILQGGTWTAGRELAFARRVDGSPPIKVISDGTVF